MRLKLENINMMNFKSFKGLHTISALDNHFTAIVGPNGSGKSNIIDGILFVLGFKAKKMRHAILKDLITTGCSECYVELVFNSFKLCRSLKGKIDESGNVKNVINKYELNGKEVSAAESIEFLKNSGIDLDNNRFLILQGEIESIAMMNPIELLEYIEDCIGTNIFKSKIEVIENDIKETQEEYDSINSRVKFVETDYLFKKGRRDEKAELLMYRNESLVLKNKIVLVKEALANRKEINLMNEKNLIQNELEKLTEKNNEYAKNIKRLEKDISKLDLKTKEEELVRYRNEYNRIDRENRSKDQKKKKIDKNIDKLKKEIEENEQAIKSWKKEAEMLEKSYESNIFEIEEFERQIESKTKEYNKFDEIKIKEKEKGRLELDLINLISKKDKIDVEINGIKALEERLGSLTEKINKIDNTNKTEYESKTLESEISNIEKDLSATLQEINRRKNRAQEFEFVEQSYKKEREVYENLKNIPGVFGVLKNLGEFDKKYEEAIEASTKSLNSIVVDKTSTAEECISIINKKRLNRTTFIILDRIGEPKPEYINANIKAEMLYEKIRTEPRFIKCFYFAIKDTLCVENLETARKLAFGKVRRRVVTLDGKLLEKSGIMCGGKTSKKLKSFSELEQIYSNMQKILENKTKQLTEISSIENQRSMLNSFIKQSEIINKEIDKKRSNINKNELNELENNILNIKNKIKELESIKLPQKAAELKGEIQILVEKIDYLQKFNQDIKIKLSSEPENNKNSLEKELNRLIKEQDVIEVDLLPDVNVLKNLEEEYNKVFREFNIIQDQINENRSKMGNDYHQEAEYKAKMEEIIDSLKEVIQIKDNCILRKNEIINEFSLTKSLLLKIDCKNIIELDNDISFINELNDSELKEKSREMIDQLNNKETANFKKLKETMKSSQDFSIEEDLEIYKLIFSEYEASKKIYDELKKSCDFVESKLEKLKIELENLSSERLSKFMDGFNNINRNIKEIFNLITFGGNAELDLIDYLNPFRDGIVLSIMPPKKSWKQISNLSGGEKTLSSLALTFALHKYKPSFFYIMDEIDAALDFKNVSVISQYLSHVDAQFIIISLRNDMFEKARSLIGVYKINDVSRAITVNLDKFQNQLKQQQIIN